MKIGAILVQGWRWAILILGMIQLNAYAASVIAVLSSASPPYHEALEGFQETFEQPISSFVLTEQETVIPDSTRLIVTFGGRAALHHYEAPEIPMVYCLAPGTNVSSEGHPRGTYKVHVSPPPKTLIRELGILQPGLRRLGVLWVNDAIGSYGSSLKSAGGAIGVNVRTIHLRSADDLPQALRRLVGRIDALWIPPDPLLVTPSSIKVLRQFAWDNDIPFFASIDSLAYKGAAATISVSFKEMGRLAGHIARMVLSHAEQSPDSLYSENVVLVINPTSAKESGLVIPTKVLERADRVIP